jgi:predicted RNase H-like nuclease
LKLLAPKKKPCRSPKHEQLSRSFTFDERRRSRSFDSEAIDALSTATTAPLGISRTRAGSYSFHGTTKSGYIVAPKRQVVTSTPKDMHNIVGRPAETFPKDLSKVSHGNKQNR